MKHHKYLHKRIRSFYMFIKTDKRFRIKLDVCLLTVQVN